MSCSSRALFGSVVGHELVESLSSEFGDAAVERSSEDVPGKRLELGEGLGEFVGAFGGQPVPPVSGREVVFEDVDEASGDRVSVNGEGVPLVEDHVDGDTELGEGGACFEEASVGDSEGSIVLELDEPELRGSLDEVGGHRSFGKPVEQVGACDDDGVGLAEEFVELGFDPDEGVDAASGFPGLEEGRDAGE